MSQDQESPCDLCEEFRGGDCAVLRHGERRIFFDRHGFVAMPTIGAYVPGYCLVCPRGHFTSLAQTPVASFIVALNDVLATLVPIFGPYLLFEHGMRFGRNAGGCVEHAHLHLVPMPDDLQVSVLARVPAHSTILLDDVGQLRDQSYLICGVANKGSSVGLIGEPTALRSQYLRRVIADELGIADRYDWAVDPFVENMRLTLRMIQG